MSSRAPVERVSDWKAWTRMALSAPSLLPFAHGSPAARVRHWALETPHAVAIAFEESSVSWCELDERADAYARWLQVEGIARGDVVALVMDNRPEFLILFTALSRIGAVAALINTQLRGPALEHALAASCARLVISGSEHIDQVLVAAAQLPAFVPDKQIVVQRDSGSSESPLMRVIDEELLPASQGPPLREYHGRMSDVCCYVYTSGTTGLPKAAVIRNQRMLGGGYTFGHLMHRSRSGDLIYVALPLYHSSALFLGWGAALATGAAIGLRRRFSVSGFWHDVHRWNATSFLYIGEMCRFLMAAPEHPEERMHGLRAAVGNGMQRELWTAFQKRFRIPVVREFYGATEGNAPLLNVSGKPGMMGRMQRGQAVVRCDPSTGEPTLDASGRCVRVDAGESGLLLGRISRTMKFDGYVDASATKKKVREGVFADGDRWFDTGDLVTVHQGNWLSFKDRVGDTFRWKGENVSTLEVSNAIACAEGVVEVTVFGVAIPGCEGRACMCALRTEAPPDLGTLTDHFERNLTRYQRPLFIRLLAEPLRTTGTFKQQTASYREEGFDPEVITDEIYVSIRGEYAPYTPARHRALLDGSLVPS